MLKVYGIKNCNSVKKGREFLEKHGIEYEFIDFKKTPPDLKLLQKWQEKFGMQKLVNRSGQTYRKLGLKEKNLSDSELLKVVSENPSTIKRPVLELENGNVYFGFDEAEYKRLF